MAGVVENRSMEESVHMGHWLASLCVRELGPQYVILSKANRLLVQTTPPPQDIAQALATIHLRCPTVLTAQLTSCLSRFPFPKHTYHPGTLDPEA